MIASDYLSKTNTTAYTPTADYHPATKKYVDDNSGGPYNFGYISFNNIYNGSNFVKEYKIYTDSSDLDFFKEIQPNLLGKTFKLIVKSK